MKYKREDEILAKGNLVPDDAPARYKENAAKWVNDIEKLETADNARTAKRVKIALPREMTLEEQKEAVESWIRENCTKHGYPATYAIHEGKNPFKDGGEEGRKWEQLGEDGKKQLHNPHVHILIANRPIKNGKWEKSKSKTEYKLDNQGNKIPLVDPATGKQKVIVQKDGRVRPQWQRTIKNRSRMDSLSTLYDMRKSWSRIANKYLSPENQIDHRSYKDQGVDKIPTIHEGYEARGIKARGGESWKCNYNDQVRAMNAQLEKLKKENKQLESSLKDVKQAKGGVLGKAGGMAGQVIDKTVGTVKGAISQGFDTVMGKADGKGVQGVMERTGENIGKSIVQGKILGAGMAFAKMPLDILKNVESEEGQQGKMREQHEKSAAEMLIPSTRPKKKEKEKGKEKKQEAPARVRGR